MKRKKLITSNTLTFQEGYTEFKYNNTQYSEYSKSRGVGKTGIHCF